MGTSGPVWPLKEKPAHRIFTIVWTGLDTSRPIFQAEGGKTGGVTHRGETNSLAMVSAESQVSRIVKPKLAYSRSELALLLGISTRSIQRLEDRGLLKSSRALRKRLYSHFEVMRFLEATANDRAAFQRTRPTLDPSRQLPTRRRADLRTEKRLSRSRLDAVDFAAR